MIFRKELKNRINQQSKNNNDDIGIESFILVRFMVKSVRWQCLIAKKES